MQSINWEQRMLAINGPRGTGKTTLMLQYIRYHLKQPKETILYVTASTTGFIPTIWSNLRMNSIKNPLGFRVSTNQLAIDQGYQTDYFKQYEVL
nr:AAA family ATPase [Cytophagales bacterium]